MNTPLEKLSLIASAFAVVDDPTADGNHAANARQTMRDVLAGHLVHVVSAGTYAARCDERDAYFREMMAKDRQGAEDKDTIAKLTADNAALRAVACVVATEGRVTDGWPTGDGFSAFMCSSESALALQDTLASPNPGAGWVSPEEHARVVLAEAYRAKGYYDVCAERDASRAESVERKMRIICLDDAVAGMMKERDAARARLDGTSALSAAKQSPGCGAGWVSPEEHAARMKEAVAHLRIADEHIDAMARELESVRLEVHAVRDACASMSKADGYPEDGGGPVADRVKAEAEGLRASVMLKGGAP